MNVIIIGAEMTGIGAAYYLRAAGISYTILSEIGSRRRVEHAHAGTAQCDSDFIKYSFSFKPYLSAQCLQERGTIQEYLREVAEGSASHRTSFSTAGCSRRSSTPVAGRWIVHTSRGSFSARFLINGNGYFSDEPYVPAFADADKFKARSFTTHLDGRRTFFDKNVVLVGQRLDRDLLRSGARARGQVARVGATLAHVHLRDRQSRRALIRICQALYRLGLRWPVKLLRRYLQLKDDLVFVGFRRCLARWFFRHHWRDAVSEDVLREHFTPRYNPLGAAHRGLDRGSRKRSAAARSR